MWNDTTPTAELGTQKLVEVLIIGLLQELRQLVKLGTAIFERNLEGAEEAPTGTEWRIGPWGHSL